MKRKLEVVGSLGGTSRAGFVRTDMENVFHTIVTSAPGEAVNPMAHWPCSVCDAHGMTWKDFQKWIESEGWARAGN